MRPPAHPRAFTLVELLVVIAIVALLMVILVPALAGATAATRQVQGLSNLRQLSTGWHIYADDHRGVCLPGRFANLGGGTANPDNWYDVGNGLKYRPRWIAVLGASVGLPAFNAPSTDEDRQDYDHEVYVCPAAADRVDERNSSYGYNYQFLGNARTTGDRFRNFPVKRSRVNAFSRTVLAADAMGTAAAFPEAQRLPYENDGKTAGALGNHAWSLDPPRLTPTSDRGNGDAASPRTAVDPRHRGRANAVFADGHGLAMTPEELGYRTDGDGSFTDGDDPGDPATNELFSGQGTDLDPPDR